jgi:hypothetical protein
MAKRSENNTRKATGSLSSEKMSNMRVEYQKAQDSAEHHDSLLWYVTSIVWSGNLILLGEVATSTKTHLASILILPISVLALVLNLFVWAAAFQFRSVKKQKYEYCKQIEDKLPGMRGQHRNLCHPPGVTWTLYCSVTILFLIVWFAFLLMAASCILR